MFDFKSITTAMGREVAERAVHEGLGDLIRKEMAKGKDAHNIVVDALIAIRGSWMLEKVRIILGPHAAGLALTGFGAGIAEWLQSADWEKTLPGNHEVLRQVRFILQQVVPSLLVGSAEALGDNWDDTVADAVSKVVSDPSSTDPNKKKGEFDYVYRIDPSHGIDDLAKYGLLFPEGYDAAGKLLVDRLGSVRLRGENGRRFVKDWYASHGPCEIEEEVDNPNRGKDNKGPPKIKRKRTVDSDPYHGFLQPLARAIEEMPATVPIDPVLRQKILDDKPKKEEKQKDELEKLDEGGEAFTIAIAKSASKLDPLQRHLVIDFVQDVTKASFINLLGKKFPPNASGEYSEAEVKAIEAYVQLWMQAKLDLKSKLRLAFEQAKLMYETDSDWLKIAKSVAQRIGIVALGTTLILTGIFALMAVLFFYAAFLMDIHATTYFWMNLHMPTVASMIIMVTSFVMIVELLLITPVEAAMSWIRVFKPDLEDDWLKHKGRITIMFIGLHAGVLMFLIANESSRMTRLMVCGAATLIAIAVQMGLVAYGFPNTARLRSKKTLVWFGVISLALFIGGIIIHFLSEQGMKPQALFALAISNIWFMTAVIFAALVVALFKVIHMSEATFTEKSTGNTIYPDKPSKSLRVLALMIALGVAGWYNYVKSEEAKKAPANPVAAAIAAILAPTPVAVPVPVAPQATAPGQRYVNIQYSEDSPTPAPKRGHVSKGSSKEEAEEDPCAGYSDSLKRRMGCP